MIRIYDFDEVKEKILERAIESGSVDRIVKSIIDDVRKRGDEALFEYAEKFDKAKLDTLRVSEEEIETAFNSVDKSFIKILEEARDNIALFHEKQLPKSFEVKKDGGIILGQKVTPIPRVGIYVPGGTASYPSTVLMNAVPAAIAGVKEIVMVTPPRSDGSVLPEVLAAAKIAGVTEIYKVGGAGAIAALAYGTESIRKVYKITGPGNIYVATAKKLVYGLVSIDMIAGPSEILVIADESASPVHVAADLLSQAEHDRIAEAVLITTDIRLANETAKELERQIPELERAEIARESIDNLGKIIIVPDMDTAVKVANEIAPEHLELYVKEPFELLSRIENAGSIFLGGYSPEPLGDYFAGPNHTLPTSGTAKFSSPLSSADYVKKSSYIYYPKEELKKVKDKVAEFAKREGLTAHAESVLKRFKETL
ncbi:MAG: histidinol dehydrogenase [Clostridiales bacterium]|nr:histidinol dehydrogenase [Clostridiales bacterium]